MKTRAVTNSKPKDRLGATLQCVPTRDLVITDPTYLIPRPAQKPVTIPVSKLKKVGKTLVATDIPTPKTSPKDPWIKWLRQFPEFASNKAITPRACRLGTLPCIVADTIFGDWHCKIRNSRGADIGDFTADSGLVVCVQVGKGRAQKRLAHVPPRCYTVISGFTGTVSIIHEKGRCWVEGSGGKDGLPFGFTSRQVG